MNWGKWIAAMLALALVVVGIVFLIRFDSWFGDQTSKQRGVSVDDKAAITAAKEQDQELAALRDNIRQLEADNERLRRALTSKIEQSTKESKDKRREERARQLGLADPEVVTEAELTAAEWREAQKEIDEIKKLPKTKQLEIAVFKKAEGYWIPTGATDPTTGKPVGKWVNLHQAEVELRQALAKQYKLQETADLNEIAAAYLKEQLPKEAKARGLDLSSATWADIHAYDKKKRQASGSGQ